MKRRFEGKTLEDVFELASKAFNSTIDRLDYDIIQYPSKGIFGIFAKSAIIEVKEKKSKQVEAKEEVEANNILADDLSSGDDIKVEEKFDKEEPNSSLKEKIDIDDSTVFESFYGNNKTPKEPKKESISASELEAKIQELFKNSCYDLDTIEVDIEDNTAYVFIDGVDAALLIGKEGYRYNALSYLLFNWVNSRYGLYLKLEIAQFLASQQDMIVNQLKPVVDHVNREGWGRTRELDGILVQIALEYLRDTFPNKYVAIKRAKSGDRYIVINEFNKR
jgi:spoIIIJ-associated protein